MAKSLPVTPILVADFTTLLLALGGSDTLPEGSLEACAALKRLEKAVKLAALAVLPKANAAFDGIQVTLESGATIKKHTKAGTWVFPDFIQSREHELNVLKETSKADGSARKDVAVLDPTKDRSFSVSAPLNVHPDDKKELLSAAQILGKPAAGAPAPIT